MGYFGRIPFRKRCLRGAARGGHIYRILIRVWKEVPLRKKATYSEAAEGRHVDIFMCVHGRYPLLWQRRDQSATNGATLLGKQS